MSWNKKLKKKKKKSDENYESHLKHEDTVGGVTGTRSVMSSVERALESFEEATTSNTNTSAE